MESLKFCFHFLLAKNYLKRILRDSRDLFQEKYRHNPLREHFSHLRDHLLYFIESTIEGMCNNMLDTHLSSDRMGAIQLIILVVIFSSISLLPYHLNNLNDLAVPSLMGRLLVCVNHLVWYTFTNSFQ